MLNQNVFGKAPEEENIDERLGKKEQIFWIVIIPNADEGDQMRNWENASLTSDESEKNN